MRGSGRGNQIVHMVVQTPTILSERQEALLREFASLNGDTPPTGSRSSLFKSFVQAIGRFFRTVMMRLKGVLVPVQHGLDKARV
jgi:DnaJ-class molecular chaperone